ncbi:MAG TPA: putative baseplate assembly protein [Verrucomicrobiae bacterium]|nr:putative baseplate assembly protein [Verrucomicrobiae bacterium]
MALPVPNLDDRRFQDLVDDAKRLVQQRCPEWTDHNVSDPGVTLIELFAWMTDQLLYRVNRIPDRNYVKFLELIGIRLFPPSAARGDVTFWLSGPQPQAVRIPGGTQAATIRTETDQAIVFTTLDDLPIVPVSVTAAFTSVDGTKHVDRTTEALNGRDFLAFESQPKPGDLLLIGLSDPAPSNALRLRFACTIEGVGVDPTWPPLAWEAWTGADWDACDLDLDTTGGLNRDGDVVIHLPVGHAASVIEKVRAGWVRARVTEPEGGQPFYSSSPNVRGLEAATVGGTAAAVHADVIVDEILGVAEGVAGGRFGVRHRPVVPGDRPMTIGVADDEAGWQEWIQVPDFADSGPDDRHFVLDAVAGEISFGPAVRQPDGAVRQYGAVPAKGARVRVDAYLTGGGRDGNLAPRAISVLKSSIPYVSRVENRRPTAGGVDGEEIENAKIRGPISLRTRGRAVTTEDFEHLALEAAPELARVHAVAAGDGADPGSVRVLVVPSAAADAGRLRFEQLLPSDETLARVAGRLDECRVVGTRVLVEPPAYRGITIVARLRARPRVNPTRLQDEALRAIYGYFHPITGGPEGTGWPFGRPVQVGEVYAVLQGLRGTELVEDVRLFGADPVTGQRGQVTQRLDLEPHALVFSYEHQLLVEGA